MINAMENDEMDESTILTPELFDSLMARMDRIQEGLNNNLVNLFKIEIELDELQNKLDKMS